MLSILHDITDPWSMVTKIFQFISRQDNIPMNIVPAAALLAPVYGLRVLKTADKPPTIKSDEKSRNKLA